ncbi:hypothetical protein M408DRAFT_23668 [Serendipita vermifera MAFF 305830]|uniref:F-box domain-containing protein n=1 Tax=Serendipita vermifera MAFF 305830 TaxID=933852 RepID=A0A0C3B974_SERVB|nr:hypothetical protein M408DRAFT_23668 [Serendipita vermifera MAFF 305830]
MPVLSLPTELWTNIASYLKRKDHLSLVHVCRDFHGIFYGPLYSSLLVGPRRYTHWEPEKHVGSSRFAQIGPESSSLLERLEADENLRKTVRTIEIMHLDKKTIGYPYRWEEDPTEPLYDAFVGDIIRICRDCPLLQKFTLNNSMIQVKWLIYLASHPGQQLDLYLDLVQLYGHSGSAAETTDYGVPEKGPSITARSLTSTRASWSSAILFEVSRLLASKSLKVLNNPSISDSDLFLALNKQGLGLTSNLESLTVSSLDRRAMHLFRQLPNLRYICALGMTEYPSLALSNIPPGHGPTSVLTRLESISIYPHLISAFTPGRNITSIRTLDRLHSYANDFVPLIPVNAGTFGRYFGSEVMVRTLEWNYCSRTDEILNYLLENNPGIWHLTIIPTGAPASQEAFTAYLTKFARFPELRTLVFPTLAHVPTPRTMAWEIERCQELREAGSKSLVSISFSALLTWTRHPDDETLWRPSGPGMETLKLKLPFISQS